MRLDKITGWGSGDITKIKSQFEEYWRMESPKNNKLAKKMGI